MATADDVLRVARFYLGTKEKPVNDVIFNTHFYGRPVSGSAFPWCVTFVWSVFQNAGAGDLIADTAYAPTLMQWFYQQHHFDMAGKPGDVAFFDFNGDKVADHVGIVESVSNGYVTSIDGNTSATNEANGGMVARRTRPLSSVLGFGHPQYAQPAVFIFYAVRVTASDFLNIRTGPGTNYPILQIPKDGNMADCFLLPGMEVAIHEERNGWGRVANIPGWVSLRYSEKL